MSSFLAPARVERHTGICTHLAPLRKRLANLATYAQINPAAQPRFASAYALYENCVRFRRVYERERSEGVSEGSIAVRSLLRAYRDEALDG